ncbi:ParB N-terminal domain-containing protein [Gordonia sp. TBRC 11910]|uniref:ParB N-terminal domain-containing protein n=1 Tax=Gordonia asplenii TaxID=2725283 RepID=A0A848KX79_9ACTN|nr:ParB N-terminal domain-containing protein [Gordonia asplenii]NMO00791.1 ParB N-terminal domain-containing protein [Gordonia asplenii]
MTRFVGTETVPLADLHPHPDNVNSGDPDAIAESLAQFSQYRSIVAAHITDGPDRLTILAGHHVVQAAALLGWETLRADVLEDVDADTAKRIMLADNKLPDLGDGIDTAALLDLLEDGLDLAGTGYTDQDLAALRDLHDQDLWTPDDAGDQGDGSGELDPKISMRVPANVFDAWRRLLDRYEGDDDLTKLCSLLRGEDLL